MTPTEAPSIFDFESFAEFFSTYHSWRKQKSRAYSFRWLQRQLKSTSRSMLGQVAKGRRLPTPKLLEELGPVLAFGDTELKYANLMIGMEQSPNPLVRENLRARLALLRPDRTTEELKLDVMTFLSEWHHITVMEMFHLKDFQADGVWISNRLGQSISPDAANASLRLLKKLKLISEDESGILRPTHQRLITPNTVPSSAIRSFHAQMLKKATEAIESQSIDQRYLSSTTFTIAKDCLKEATAEIDRFSKSMAKLLQRKDGDETYQLTMQLFSLTKS